MCKTVSQILTSKFFRSTPSLSFGSNVSFEGRLIKKLAQSVFDGDLAQAKQEFRWMLDHLNEKSKNVQLKGYEASITNLNLEDKITQFVKERVEDHKPLQYILGTQPFGDLDLMVRQPVLIPRWETEEWVLNLCAMLNNIGLFQLRQDALKILDVGTGSGCIALLLASKLPKGSVEVFGIDLSHKALKLALENKTRNQRLLQNPVHFLKVDILDDEVVKEFIDVHGPVDMIVSNPPYITPSDYSTLTPDVKDWEDPRALVTEDEFGLQFYRRIIELSVAFKPLLLRPFLLWNSTFSQSKYPQIPQLVLEIGSPRQASLVPNLIETYFKQLQVLKDLVGKERVIIASE